MKTGALTLIGLSQRGQSLVEYALVISLVAIVVIIALGPFGKQIKYTICVTAYEFVGGAADSCVDD